ncbi:serpin family protein, partial [Klebsiella pneumoniae]|uniref:serpin family protein n=1 Tax=Klebsiella pneumoniae TaxID=573 RepID=UPI001E45C805
GGGAALKLSVPVAQFADAAPVAKLKAALADALGKPVEVKADHPFVFFLRESKHGRLLFVGRLSNPKS